MKTYLLPDPAEFERSLARRISGSSRLLARWTQFSGGEMHVRVSGTSPSVAVVGWTAPPHDDVFLTALLCDTLRRDGAKDILLILPYYAYARQDRKLAPGDPESAACIANLMAAAGATRILTVDLHSRAFSSPIAIESVSVLPEMAARLRGELDSGGCVVVAPDEGARERAEQFRAAFGAPSVAWIEKRRAASGAAKAVKLHGVVEGRTAVIVDDMVDQGGTVEEAVRLLRAKGAKGFRLCAAHAVLSGDGVERLRRLRLDGIIFSDTLDLPEEAERLENLGIVSSIPSLAAAALLHGDD